MRKPGADPDDSTSAVDTAIPMPRIRVFRCEIPNHQDHDTDSASSSVQMQDRILVLDNADHGPGTHEELLSRQNKIHQGFHKAESRAAAILDKSREVSSNGTGEEVMCSGPVGWRS